MPICVLFRARVLTQKAAERAHHLLAADVIAVAEVERRESELEVARAELEAAKDQLRLLGVDSAVLKELSKQGHILPSVTINSSRNGIVIARNVIVGQVVQPADQLFGVADLSSVWVVGDVPEQIARNVRIGQHVEIHVPALGDINFRRADHIRGRHSRSDDPHGHGAHHGGESAAQTQA